MTSRLSKVTSALVLVVAALGSSPVGASHFNQFVNVYDTASGSGNWCFNVRTAKGHFDALCSDVGVVQNFNNRISSYRFSGEWNRCVVFYAETWYGGAAWVAFGHDWGNLVAFPSWFNNVASSLRFGYRYQPYAGAPSYCGSPWS